MYLSYCSLYDKFSFTIRFNSYIIQSVSRNFVIVMSSPINIGHLSNFDRSTTGYYCRSIGYYFVAHRILGIVDLATAVVAGHYYTTTIMLGHLHSRTSCFSHHSIAS
jgi:hypothetical protein